MKLSNKQAYAVCILGVLFCQMTSVPEVEAGRRRSCRAVNRTPLLPRRRQVAAGADPAAAGATDEKEDIVVDPNWGTVRGRFVFGGDPPAPREVTVHEELGPLYDESLSVDQDNGGVANVVVWLHSNRNQPPSKIHPAYDAAANDDVVLAITDLRFEPRVVVLWTQQTLLIQNETKNGRGVKIDTFNNPPAAPVLTDKWSIEFDQPERLPTPVSDAVAPWLRGHLVLNDHPYAVASRSDGSFELRNLPVGTWNFKLWHERSGYLEAMTIDGQTKTARFGQLTLTIEPGDNDLGDIVLPPAEFER